MSQYNPRAPENPPTPEQIERVKGAPELQIEGATEQGGYPGSSEVSASVRQERDLHISVRMDAHLVFQAEKAKWEKEKKEMLRELALAPLNPVIRHTVETLRSWGFDAQDSGDGKTHGHTRDPGRPYIYIRVSNPSALMYLACWLESKLATAGIKAGMANPEEPNAPTIEACYLPSRGLAFIHLFNVVIPEPQL